MNRNVSVSARERATLSRALKTLEKARAKHGERWSDPALRLCVGSAEYLTRAQIDALIGLLSELLPEGSASPSEAP